MTRPSELTALIKEGGIPKGLERYFPPCTRDGCTRRKPHNDVLDFQAEFVLAPEKYLALIGGYGSGKTLPAAVLGVLLSKQIRGNRGFVGRRTYSKLHDSTQRIFLDVIQRVGLEYTQREVRDGLPHTIILSNESEIVFRETKDVGRFLGPEYGWFYLDEAAEEPKKTFTDLQSRLRLQQAKRNLKGFITSNPPHHTDWIPELFGIAPGTQERAGSKYRLWQVATTRNPYLPEGYIADLRANHPESEVRRIIDGQYGFAFEGKAVYAPPFEFGRHVAELTPLVGYGVVRVFDWGFHCVLPEAEMLTAQGWRRVADVAVGESVATLNEVTGAIEYEETVGKTDEPYDGPLYRWRHRSLDLAVTAGHRMLFTPSRGPGQLRSARADAMPRVDCETPQGVTASEKSIGAAWAVMLGLYLSEGSTERNWHRRFRRDRTMVRSAHYQTWIWQKHEDPWMAGWLARSGYPWRYYRGKRGGRGWSVAGKGLHEYLARFGGSRQKYVPDEVKRAPAEEIRLFLEAYRRGDGTVIHQRGRQPREVITTYSARMANDLQELYALVGVTASVRPHREGFIVAPRRSGATLDPRALTVTPYAGRVVCVETPNHTLLVRYPGSIPVWVGNSPAVSWHQFPICDRGRPHWRVQHEYVGANIESEQLADIALEQSAAMFPDHPPTHFLNGADRSGTQVGEKGPGPIRRLYHSHRLHFRTRHVANIDPGLALVRQALRDQCGCGRPVFAIDRRCRHMIDALAGGYHYTAARYGLSKTREKDKPHKDGFYDNIADTLRYAGELFYRPALRDPGIEDRMLTDDLRRDSTPPPPYAWMG